jgi:hypothetical protein
MRYVIHNLFTWLAGRDAQNAAELVTGADNAGQAFAALLWLLVLICGR